MANFLRLEDAAGFYDVCLRHWTTACALIPAPAHRMVSEWHVDDVGAEIGPLLDWLGLAQNVEMLDHRKTALKRGLITTASYSQVTEPINQRAAGRCNDIVDIWSLFSMFWRHGQWNLAILIRVGARR